jgi:hypothetical protein
VGIGEAINIASSVLSLARINGIEILTSKDVILGLENRVNFVDHRFESDYSNKSIYYQIIQEGSSKKIRWTFWGGMQNA